MCTDVAMEVTSQTVAALGVGGGRPPDLGIPQGWLRDAVGPAGGGGSGGGEDAAGGCWDPSLKVLATDPWVPRHPAPSGGGDGGGNDKPGTPPGAAAAPADDAAVDLFAAALPCATERSLVRALVMATPLTERQAILDAAWAALVLQLTAGSGGGGCGGSGCGGGGDSDDGGSEGGGGVRRE